ncbi:4Fe-4S binding protein [Streptomyces sp. NPDC047000]|uniref:4Fe-4S binding protein n=1 Tax=Streptomyces sp. NPDC047000 TaxID=3155474 RepID=UPI0033F5330E
MTVTPTRRNLLDYKPVRAVARSRWYPGVLQYAATAVFAVVVYQLLVGPQAAHDNLGTALVWVLWWPLIPVVFVAVGRAWCTVCPFGKLSDLVQRLVGVNRPVPRFLKRYGIWIIDAQFIAITWADHVFGIVESPWGTGMLLLLMTTAVVVSGAFFTRRTFCRYLCFLGGLSGNYARTGAVALRADTGICATCTARAACFNGGDAAPACPLFEFPRTMDSSANCNLCANCVKNCPNDAITLTLRPPTKELWFVRRPRIEETFLAVAIMGIVFIQNITMLGVWNDVLDWISGTFGITGRGVIFTAAFAVAIAVPAALLAAASFVASRVAGGTVRDNFTRFGYALIPLDVAGHVAHNLFHLLAEGRSVFYTALEALGRQGSYGASTAFVPTGTIQVLQYAVVALGVTGSAYTAWRIARGPAAAGTAPSAGSAGPGGAAGPAAARTWATLAPYAVLLLVFGAFNVYLFALPMAMRM